MVQKSVKIKGNKIMKKNFLNVTLKGTQIYIVLIIVLSAIYSKLLVYIPMFIQYALDGVIMGDEKVIPNIIRRLFVLDDKVFKIMVLILVLILINIIACILNYFKSKLNIKFNLKINRNVKEIILEHIDLQVKYLGENTGIKEMRKYMSYYLKNLPNATQMRQRINQIETKQELQDCIITYFKNI